MYNVQRTYMITGQQMLQILCCQFGDRKKTFVLVSFSLDEWDSRMLTGVWSSGPQPITTLSSPKPLSPHANSTPWVAIFQAHPCHSIWFRAGALWCQVDIPSFVMFFWEVVCASWRSLECQDPGFPSRILYCSKRVNVYISFNCQQFLIVAEGVCIYYTSEQKVQLGSINKLAVIKFGSMFSIKLYTDNGFKISIHFKVMTITWITREAPTLQDTDSSASFSGAVVHSIPILILKNKNGSQMPELAYWYHLLNFCAVCEVS